MISIVGGEHAHRNRLLSRREALLRISNDGAKSPADLARLERLKLVVENFDRI